MQIKIEAESAIKMWALNLFSPFIILLILRVVFGSGFLINAVLIVYAVVSIVTFLIKRYTINTLEYDVEESQLIKSWHFITKSKEIARLQVINSIDINQTFLERLFNIYSLTVDYGFSNEGYTFTLNYLNEQEADRIAEYIKPSGRQILVK